MPIEVDGKTVETTENGFLVNAEDWSEAVGQAIADDEGIAMTEQQL